MKMKNKVKRKILFWGFIILSLILIAIFADVITTHNPRLANLDNKLLPPCSEYLLGTDHMGRCILCRIIYGARISLLVAGIVVSITFTLGTTIGIISGYYGGIIDNILMRIVDVFLAFPSFLFTLSFVGICGGGIKNLVIALSIFGWMYYARIVRGEVLVIKEKEFVKAIKGMGVGNIYILFHHILPNILGPAIVIATMDIGGIILSTSGLSFLGVGIHPPTPEWVYMLNNGKVYLSSNPNLIIFPGIAIVVTILAFNFLGDNTKDYIDVNESKYLKIGSVN